MTITVETLPNCVANLHIIVPAETVTKQRSGIVSYYASIAQIPGFRPGKVPASVIEKRYKDAVQGELDERLLGGSVHDAIAKEQLNVLNVVAIRDKVYASDGSFSFTAEVTLAPKLELPEYKGIQVKLPRIEVNDADVEHDLFHLRERAGSYDDVERPAGKGDAVILSYTVSMDGKPMEELHPELPVHFRKLESNGILLGDDDDFLPGFNAALIGISKDESRQFNITLPEDFHTESLRGKTLTFDAKCEAVKVRNLPEVNDDFAKQMLGEDATVESLRSEIRDAVRNRREQSRDNAMTNQILEHLAGQMDFELPKHIVDREVERQASEMARNVVNRQGVSEDEILKHEDALLQAATPQAQRNVRTSFILDEVAKREDLNVSDAQVMGVIANHAARIGKPIKQVLAQAQKDGTIDRLRSNLLIENAIEFLKSNAVVEEVDPETEKHGCEFEKQSEA